MDDQSQGSELTEGDRVSLRLDLDRGAEPVSGRLSAADGRSEEFVGWIGLGTALRHLTGPTDRQSPPA